jgi:hypothetical protein
LGNLFLLEQVQWNYYKKCIELLQVKLLRSDIIQQRGHYGSIKTELY